MKIILPYPPRDLMPNRKNGKHFRSTKDIKDKAFKDAYYCALENKPAIPLSKDGKYKISLVYFQKDKINRDLDNLLAASKSQIDGIAKALKIDDKQFAPMTIDRGFSDKSYLQVEIF